jgi:hypothetical protein
MDVKQARIACGEAAQRQQRKRVRLAGCRGLVQQEDSCIHRAIVELTGMSGARVVRSKRVPCRDVSYVRMRRVRAGAVPREELARQVWRERERGREW